MYINSFLLFVILHKLCLTLFMGGGGAGSINQLGLLSAARVANPDPIFFFGGGGVRIRFFLSGFDFFWIRIRLCWNQIRFLKNPDSIFWDPNPSFFGSGSDHFGIRIRSVLDQDPTFFGTRSDFFGSRSVFFRMLF